MTSVYENISLPGSQDDALSDVRFRERAMQALGSYHVHWLRLAVQTIVGAKVPATTGAATSTEYAQAGQLSLVALTSLTVCP